MMEPIVRLMVPCEDVRPRKGAPKKTDIYGVLSTIWAHSFPSKHTFAVYLALTNGHGRGQGRIVVTDEETGTTTYIGENHTFDFANDPVAVLGFVIRVPACPFSKPGVYKVTFVYNGTAVLKECTVLVREKS